MRDVFALAVVVPLVFGGATLLGHGRCGTAQRSPTSVAVTTTFMTTAILATLVLRGLTGGDL